MTRETVAEVVSIGLQITATLAVVMAVVLLARACKRRGLTHGRHHAAAATLAATAPRAAGPCANAPPTSQAKVRSDAPSSWPFGAFSDWSNLDLSRCNLGGRGDHRAWEYAVRERGHRGPSHSLGPGPGHAVTPGAPIIGGHGLRPDAARQLDETLRLLLEVGWPLKGSTGQGLDGSQVGPPSGGGSRTVRGLGLSPPRSRSGLWLSWG